jgi:hypothetical protein
MSILKKTISIDENIAKEASAISSNFSAVVEAALIEYIQHYRAEKAIQSFGKWVEREESSAKLVAELRSQDDRDFAKRKDSKIKKTKRKG